MTRVATRLSTAPATTTLPAEDLDRAKAFYEEKLGLETEVRDEMPDGLLVHAGKGTEIFLYQRERTKADNTALVFEVDDVVPVVEDLRAHGVVFEDYDLPNLKTVDGIVASDVDKAAWFKDTEGNILCVHSLAA